MKSVEDVPDLDVLEPPSLGVVRCVTDPRSGPTSPNDVVDAHLRTDVEGDAGCVRLPFGVLAQDAPPRRADMAGVRSGVSVGGWRAS